VQNTKTSHGAVLGHFASGQGPFHLAVFWPSAWIASMDRYRTCMMPD